MGNNDSRYVGLVGKQAVRPILGGRWSLATSQILGKCDAIAVKIATRQNEVEEVLSTRPEVNKALRVAAMQVTGRAGVTLLEKGQRRDARLFARKGRPRIGR